jgi:hypothetical protein
VFASPPGWRLDPNMRWSSLPERRARCAAAARGGRPLSRRIVAVIAAALLPAAVVVQRASGQSNPAGESSTMKGIYSVVQARRGEDTYMSICVGCHPAGTYTSQAFRTTWSGRTVGDLFNLISQTMPQNDPGSLAPEEYAQVIAYILKQNGVPAGTADIPTDLARLKQIRIEMPSGPLPKK